ncbi:hypothetical protein ACFCXF_34275 [Streptomyces virginiae]|uniref:TRAFAC clade GTPase domain-containing protein n=1 Tax=Streptomyces virginiae TaxID=1961 RepID=UPI00324FDF5F
MDVVMLGGTDAGKTTYLSLMYRWLGEGVGGFSCRAADPYAHQTLTDTGRSVLAGTYPRKTTAPEVHDLVLRYQDQDVLPFRWRDHRGKALTETRASNADVGQLQEDLRAADGIMLFAEAPELLAAGQSRLVRSMTTAVVRALGEREGRRTPLVIALTKFDLVEGRGSAVMERLKEPFAGLAEQAGANPNVRGAFVPLVCGPRPSNVQIPALWLLNSGLISRAERAAADADEALRRGIAAAGQDTLLDRVLSWLDSSKSWRRISEEALEEARAEHARLQPLLTPADRLDGLLRNVDSF